VPLHTYRGWVERVEEGGLFVRCKYTNAGSEHMFDINREDIPVGEFAKAQPGSYCVLKVRADRGGRFRKQTFYVVERYWTKNEMKKARKAARELDEVFGHAEGEDDHA
jgi:hypothetical protein